MNGALETVRVPSFRDKLLRALYTEHPTPATLALLEEVTEEEADALLIEAESLLNHGLAPNGEMFLFEAKDIEKMHPLRVKAYRLVIEIVKPEWVERVRFACMFDNTWDSIKQRSKVPDYAALAIIRNMKERGELPPVIVESD